MSRDTTDTDRRALDIYREFAARHGRGPTYTELGEALGMSSPNNANRVVRRLADAGLIPRPGRTAGRPRGSAVSVPPPPLVFPYGGRVRCGDPTPPDDTEGETIDLGPLLRGGQLVAFTATGTSMEDAHIVAGDTLLLRPCPDPEDGDVVVCRLDGEVLCKRFRRTRRRAVVRLEPRAGGLEPIEVDTSRRELEVIGVLQTLVRAVRF